MVAVSAEYPSYLIEDGILSAQDLADIVATNEETLSKHALRRDDGRPDGSRFYLVPKPWDSQQLTVAVSQLHAHGATADARWLKSNISELLDLSSPSMTFTKINSWAVGWLQALEDAGFRIADCELTLRRKFPFDAIDTKGVVDVRLHDPREPAPDLSNLTGYIDTRFHRDPRISNSNAHRLWRESVNNHISGLASAAYVATHGGDVLGIITCQDHEYQSASGEIRVRNLFHVQVAKDAAGKGVGSCLVARALRDAERSRFNMVIVSTQSTNIPALAFYQKMGFRIVNSAYAMHFWQ